MLMHMSIPLLAKPWEFRHKMMLRLNPAMEAPQGAGHVRSGPRTPVFVFVPP